MKKRMFALLLSLVLLVSIAGCGTQTPAETTAPSAPANEDFQPYTFTDSLGHQVEITEEITAVVPSGSLAQVILLGIAPDLFAGLGSKLSPDAAPYIADFDRLSGLTYFGTILGSADLDVEALASTNADIVIDMGYLKNGLAEELARVEDLTGMKCVYIEAGIGNYPDAIRQVGALLGREERAEEMAQWCETVDARAQRILEQVGDHRVNAMYVLGDEGLNVIAQGTSQAEVLDMLTNNVAVIEGAQSTGKGTAVNMEQVAIWNPEFIIFGTGSIYATAADDATWSQIDAIAKGNFVETPDQPYNWTVMPPASQRYLAMLWLPAILYPEYCDYDLQEEVTEYYELFLGVTLSDDQYAALTANAFVK